MRIHDIAFYAASFFIFGVLIASISLDFLTIIFATLLVTAVLLFTAFNAKKTEPSSEVQSPKISFFRRRHIFWLAGLSLIIILGALYYIWWDNQQINAINLAFDQSISFSGLVVSYPRHGQLQSIIVDLQHPYSGKTLIKTQSYPSFNYGDLLEIKGVINQPTPNGYGAYLAKDSIFGISNFPEINRIATDKASPKILHLPSCEKIS